MGERVVHLLDRIDLTTEQRRQVLDILDAQQDVAQKARRSLIENRAALREVVLSDSWDEAKVRELASSQAKETADRIVARGRDHASGSRAAE